MKSLPLITLALCGSFLVFRQTSVLSLTRKNTNLETRIANSSSADGGAGGPGQSGSRHGTKSSRSGGTTGGRAKPPETLAEVDLHELAETITMMESGALPDVKAIIRIQSLLLEASPEEITDLIERTAELDVPEEVKRDMIEQFVEGLGEHDPRAALKVAFESPYLDVDRQSWQFTKSFSGWIKEDQTNAIAWFDQQLAAGSFESKALDTNSRARIQFEAAALSSLLGTDPAAARTRLLALPENERLQILTQGHRLVIDSDNARAFGDLVRQMLPAEEHASILASVAGGMVRQGDYTEVGQYIAQLNSPPEERRRIISRATRSHLSNLGRLPTPEDLANLQDFARTHAPGEVSVITGQALGHYGRSNDNLNGAMELVRNLHRENPDDQLLVGFLQSTGSDESATRELAPLIQDPTLRAQFLESLK